jgi:hypothetical protein
MTGGVKCRLGLAEPEDCKKTFFPKPVDITITESFFAVDLVARVFFEGLSKGTTFVREKECMAQVFGSFDEQIPATDRGHHPAEEFKEYKDFVLDQIGARLDLTKNCSDGRAVWNIPLEIVNDGKAVKSSVIQEFRLERRVFTIIKGESVLFQGNIDITSPTEQEGRSAQKGKEAKETSEGEKKETEEQ